MNLREKMLTGMLLIVVLTTWATVASAKQGIDIPTDLRAGDSDIHFDASSMVGRIKSERSLTTLAMEHRAIGEQAIAFGFAAKSNEAKFFIIGSLYMEALAHLQSGATDLAAKLLEAIEQEVIALQAPSSLYDYISKTRNMIERKRYDTEVLTEFLAMFQPLWEEYARAVGEDQLVLFRAGSWLAGMGLGAAAQDMELLRQPVQARYFADKMKKLDAPKGVIQAFEQIREIAAKTEITEADTAQVLKLVKQAQTILA